MVAAVALALAEQAGEQAGVSAFSLQHLTGRQLSVPTSHERQGERRQDDQNVGNDDPLLGSGHYLAGQHGNCHQQHHSLFFLFMTIAIAIQVVLNKDFGTA